MISNFCGMESQCSPPPPNPTPLYETLIALVQYIRKFHCSQSAEAQHRLQRSAPTGNGINTSSLPYIEVLRGRDGRDGRDGVPGLRGPQGQRGEQGVAGPPGPRNGGVVYTRWGKTSCPNVTGTELVYAGRAGGTWYGHTGGGANHLCMPNDPDYLRYTPGVQGYSYVYGAEYEAWGGGPITMSPVLCAMLQQEWQSP